MTMDAVGSPTHVSQRSTAPVRSSGYMAYRRKLRNDTLFVKLTQAGLVGLLLLVWEVAPRMGWINPMLTSYPSAIFRTLVAMSADGTLVMHTWTTVREIFVGFIGGMVLGTLVAIALWASPMLYRIADPFIVVLNALPKIALVPIFYIWLGDMASIYAMAIAVSIFVTVLMLYSGFQAVDPDKIRLVRLFGASKFRVLTKIVLPGSVPTMISTLKVNVGLALVGVIVGEFMAAKAGLGYLITYGSQIFQINLVMTAVLVLALISSILFMGIQALLTTVLKRYDTTAAGN